MSTKKERLLSLIVAGETGVKKDMFSPLSLSYLLRHWHDVDSSAGVGLKNTWI
jgi:hypothetical protein